MNERCDTCGARDEEFEGQCGACYVDALAHGGVYTNADEVCEAAMLALGRKLTTEEAQKAEVYFMPELEVPSGFYVGHASLTPNH